jgi:predicted GIY-YIG superfamily endonuclease
MQCGEPVKNPNHDLCYSCFTEKEDEDSDLTPEDHFEFSLLDNKIYTVYIMFYGKKENKIGYSADLNSRLIEIRRQYPNNEFVYFREFSTETEARRYEAWLKTLSDRELTKFIADFQNKVSKIKRF